MNWTKHNSKLWSSIEPDGRGNYAFYCPACKELHTFRIGSYPPNVPIWQFNKNLESPTFTPSLRYLTGTKCHLTLTDGIIQFHSDCPHDLKGTKVPMVDIPSDY